ncbi:MAG: hypothetical protein LUE27_01770 [Clostridia bacterium]|nr:hypothetical protein [Clostridia bacterium]
MNIILCENRRLFQGEGYDIQCWNKPEDAVPCMRTCHSPRFDVDSWIYYEELTPYRAFTVLYGEEMELALNCVITDESMKEKMNRFFGYRLKRYILYLGKTCTDISGLRWLNIEEYLKDPIDPAAM